MRETAEVGWERQPCQLCRAEEHPSRISLSHSLWGEPASVHFYSSFFVCELSFSLEAVGFPNNFRALGNSVWKFHSAVLCVLDVYPFSWTFWEALKSFSDRKFCWIIFLVISSGELSVSATPNIWILNFLDCSFNISHLLGFFFFFLLCIWKISTPFFHSCYLVFNFQEPNFVSWILLALPFHW